MTPREPEKMTLLDPVTRLTTKGYAEIFLWSRLQAIERSGSPLGVIVSGIDDFGGIVERHGHAGAEEVARILGFRFLNTGRPSDVLSRWTRQKFLAIIDNPAVSDLPAIAERYRRAAERLDIHLGPEHVSVTVSLGGALACPADTPETLVRRAEELMGRGMASGGNCVSIA